MREGMPLRTWLSTARSFLALLLISVVSLVAISAAPASAATAHGIPAMPDQGIFENCPLDTNLAVCEQRLQVMHDGGVKVVVIGLRDSNSLTNIAAYAQAAQSLGMSVMWEINDPVFWGGSPIGASAAADFADFSTACGCTSTGQVLTYMIQWLAALPNTYGYYAADDESISVGQTTALTTYVSEIKALDPGAMVMLGAYPSAGAANAGTGATLGEEIYPVTTNQLMPSRQHQAMWGSVRWSITSDQKIADNHGYPSAFILQAFTFGDNLSDGEAVGVCTPTMSQQTCYSKLQYPSQSTQLRLRNQVILHAHPKLILWYNFDQTYGQAGTDTYTLYPTGSLASARWASLSAAIKAPSPYVAIAQAARARRHPLVIRYHRPRARRVRAGARYTLPVLRFASTTGIRRIKIRVRNERRKVFARRYRGRGPTHRSLRHIHVKTKGLAKGAHVLKITVTDVRGRSRTRTIRFVVRGSKRHHRHHHHRT